MAEKKKSYYQTFKDCYSKEFPCIKASSEGEKYAYCIYCRSSFTISHGGWNAITKHVGMKKHLDNVELANISKKCKICNFFKEDNQSAVIRTELYFTSFMTEHNVPWAVGDYADALFREMFSSCDFVKQYACVYMKTTTIVKELTSSAIEDLITQISTKPFSIACDGSNDSDHKLYLLIIIFF